MIQYANQTTLCFLNMGNTEKSQYLELQYSSCLVR